MMAATEQQGRPGGHALCHITWHELHSAYWVWFGFFGMLGFVFSFFFFFYLKVSF